MKKVKNMMRLHAQVILLTALCLLFSACRKEQEKRLPSLFAESGGNVDSSFMLNDILAAGELIAGTLSGPETYFTYRDRGFGVQYELMEEFARAIGTQLRMEVARDTAELLTWLSEGEVDIVAMQMPRTEGMLRCSNMWLVNPELKELQEAVDMWYHRGLLTSLEKRNAKRQKEPAVKRKAQPLILNAKKGIISKYDALLQRGAASIGWDWRLLAAQCYQESAFDPRAVSWAGARGLMQIMPATGAALGLSNPWDPEQNISAAVKYLGQLQAQFSDIGDRNERINFVLAAYNGGMGHVRDAMALAKAHGANPHRWREVERYVLLLQKPQYYTQPCVHYGYLIGTETAGYVSAIQERWRQYCGQAAHHSSAPAPSKPNTRIRPKSSFMVDSL